MNKESSSTSKSISPDPTHYNNNGKIQKKEEEIEKKANKNPITFGKCSRLYFYILGSGSFKLVSSLLLGANSIHEDGIGLFGFCPVIYNYNFIQSIYTYIGYIIFGLIFYFFRDVSTKDKKDDNTIKYKNTFQQNYISSMREKTFQIDEKTKNIKWEILLLCIAFVVQSETKKMLYKEGFQFFNFWTLEIIFMQFLMGRYFIIYFYAHHKISILFNVLFGSSILIIASFLPTSLSTENKGNSYQNINNKFGNYFYCILFILVFIVLSIIFCFSRIYSKVLMQIKFVSPYKIIFLFGITGMIISITSSLVAYSIDYEDNLINYFSELRSVLDKGKTYKFYGEIFLVYPLYIFSNFMEFTFEMLTIYYLNPIYILMTNTLYYGISELIFFLLNSSSDGLVIIHFILTELTEILISLGLMVYLEIIELNFCGFDKNLKSTIIKKGEDETKLIFHGFPIIDEDDDMDEDFDIEKNNTSMDSKQFGDINRYHNI